MVVIADKKSKLEHKLFKRVEYFKLGKRQVAFLNQIGAELAFKMCWKNFENQNTVTNIFGMLN